MSNERFKLDKNIYTMQIKDIFKNNKFNPFVTKAICLIFNHQFFKIQNFL